MVWSNKRGMRAFGLQDKNFAQETKVMAANQGLYNGFLAAGLLWSILSKKIDVAIFFLICLAIADIYGAYSTQKNKILYIQTIPALLAISSLLFLQFLKHPFLRCLIFTATKKLYTWINILNLLQNYQFYTSLK